MKTAFSMLLLAAGMTVSGFKPANDAMVPSPGKPVPAAQGSGVQQQGVRVHDLETYQLSRTTITYDFHSRAVSLRATGNAEGYNDDSTLNTGTGKDTRLSIGLNAGPRLDAPDAFRNENVVVFETIKFEGNPNLNNEQGNLAYVEFYIEPDHYANNKTAYTVTPDFNFEQEGEDEDPLLNEPFKVKKILFKGNVNLVLRGSNRRLDAENLVSNSVLGMAINNRSLSVSRTAVYGQNRNMRAKETMVPSAPEN